MKFMSVRTVHAAQGGECERKPPHARENLPHDGMYPGNPKRCAASGDLGPMGGAVVGVGESGGTPAGKHRKATNLFGSAGYLALEVNSCLHTRQGGMRCATSLRPNANA